MANNFKPSDYGKAFQKPHKGHSGKITGFASEVGRKLMFGNYGLKILEAARIKPTQLEAMRKVLIKMLGRNILNQFRVFAHKPVTAKPTSVRMGNGKGAPKEFVAFVQAGHLIFEIDSALPEAIVIEAIKSASKKLGCKYRIVKIGEFR